MGVDHNTRWSDVLRKGVQSGTREFFKPWVLLFQLLTLRLPASKQ